jgi:hypothetical protein
MKKFLSIIVCLSLVSGAVVLTSCKKKTEEPQPTSDVEETISEETKEVAGGWTTADSPVISDEFKTVFEKATSELDGVNYEPVAYLASQVVAGTNHCVLCKATPVVPDAKTTYSIVIVYEDLEGNAKITDVFASKGNNETSNEDLVGGWTEPESPAMTEAATEAFSRLSEANYKPLALISTQVVSGINYRMLCEKVPATPDPESRYAIITVYEDIDGNTQITETIEFSK